MSEALPAPRSQLLDRHCGRGGVDAAEQVLAADDAEDLDVDDVGGFVVVVGV